MSNGVVQEQIVELDGRGAHTDERRSKRQREPKDMIDGRFRRWRDDTYRHQDATDAHVRTESFTDSGAFPEDA